MHKPPGLPLPRNLRPTRFADTLKTSASPRSLFIEGYASFAGTCRRVEEPGLAVIAIDDATGTVIANLGLRPCLGRPTIATLGRHPNCDLVLWNDAIALRHIAVVIEPVTSWAHGAGIPYRVFDLRSTIGLSDETGRSLRGFRADGPAIMRCGNHTIFLLPLGDPSDWPESPGDAWDMIPQRVYLDERTRGSQRSQRTSLIYRTPALHDAVDLLAGDWVGNLEIRQPSRGGAIAVGRMAVRNGVLIGRYDRCDLGGIGDRSLSRVHALLVEVGGRHVLADLSSSFGIGPIAGPRARVVELADGTGCWLGSSTELTWRAGS